MLISKFDLYKREWLELVFDDRNKEYGAYELRQHYARDMVRSMGLMFFGVFLLCLAYVFFRPIHVAHHVTEVVIPPFVTPPPIKHIKDIKPPTPAKPERVQQPAPHIATQRLVPMVVTSAPVVENPPKTIDITGDIGPVTTPGKTGTSDPTKTGDGPVTAPVPVTDTRIRNTGELDVMPEPVGGNAAWAKFLNKTLRFPAPAQDEGASGRVILSFIIEKDGSLSNIKVDVPAGHGFDEEAMRVLKLAKAWKPGLQNGQPVRVKFNIPINFQALEQ